MSTVLWVNQLLDGVVTSNTDDKYALNAHLKKLDALCKAQNLLLLSAMCDSTDLQFSFGDAELPAGMTSTNELMAVSGVWVSAADAVAVLAPLLAHIQASAPRFGLFRNDYGAVVEELTEALMFAQASAALGAKFNFSIVG
jgi:hypothetical protein